MATVPEIQQKVTDWLADVERQLQFVNGTDDGTVTLRDGRVLKTMARLQQEARVIIDGALNPRLTSLADAMRNRVPITSGGYYENRGANQTGAIKIKLPLGIDPRKNTITVQVDDQYGTLTFVLTGTNNTDGWAYTRARVEGASDILKQHPVRFGRDGTGYCVWIGNTDYAFWTDLAVTILGVTFTGGPITETWTGAWSISLATAFDTVTAGPIIPSATLSNENIVFDNPRLAMRIGPFTGTGVAASNYNVSMGAYAGGALTSGFNNTLVGMEAGKSITVGSANAVFGTQAMPNGVNVVQNVAINIHALLSLTEGIGNIAIGAGAMQRGLTISANVAIGSYAGEYNTGVRCIFIGDRAGRLKTDGNDKLYIGNVDDTNALIEGDMAAGTLEVNGTLTADTFFVDGVNAAPASATAPGRAGEIRYTPDAIYVCTAANVWKRTPLSTF